ncbi:anti-sigma regulatory factor [Caballeronia sp. NCTM1]|uniref:anti-sigma regulatory factor n=1 Tax=Caballeronia sp. NCTM1 TaxID=2921753 RepID=UPI00202823E5|nr:anti-sigma regulatory factor [Caballeronia sp. NCTM1]
MTASCTGATVAESETLPIRSNEHVVRARQFLRDKAIGHGLSSIGQTKLVTAASELARNTRIYGGGGEMRYLSLQCCGRRGIKLEFVDHGPGIADIPQALTDGFTSGGGMGLGLGGAKRLCDDFEIRSSPGEGTYVSITMWGSS